MGLMDFFKQLFGGSSSNDEEINVSVNENDDDDDESIDSPEYEWQQVQQTIARFEASPMPMCGLNVNDPSTYWAMRNSFEDGMGQGKEMSQCVMAAGFKSIDHWETVESYFNAKWSEFGVNEDGEKAIKLKDEFTNALLNSRNNQLPNMQAAAVAADPALLAPVNGVTLEQWAKSASAIAKLGAGASKDQVAKVLASNGLDQATYDTAQAGWTQKMQGDTTFAIATEYGKYFSTAQGVTAGGAEPCSFDLYVEIMEAQTAWSTQGIDVNAQMKNVFGITAADFGAYGSYWGPKMNADIKMYHLYNDLSAKYAAKYAAVDQDDDLAL